VADHGYGERQQSASDPKKIHLDTELSDWKDDDSFVVSADEDEVYKYGTAVFTDTQTNSFNTVVDGELTFDIGKFWFDADIKKRFPLLSRVAIGLLSVPASSASSERVFSTAGRIVEKRRNKLSSKSVDTLLFLHSQQISMD
jgi:hypothetical protein